VSERKYERDDRSAVLSRVQFAYTASFHIIFPTITIGLSLWLAALAGFFLPRAGSCMSGSSHSG